VIVGSEMSGDATLRDMLESEGYAVEQPADDGKIVDGIGAVEPNLVLIDSHLSTVDPFELREALAASDPSRDVPVIFITDLDDAEMRLRGLESGDDLIVRPYDRREVLARIERQVTVSKVRSALRESEAEFRSVMESAIDAIITGDADGRIRSWNSAATALFGHTEADVLGKPIEIIIPDRYHEAHQAGVRRVSSGAGSCCISGTSCTPATRYPASRHRLRSARRLSR